LAHVGGAGRYRSQNAMPSCINGRPSRRDLANTNAPTWVSHSTVRATAQVMSHTIPSTSRSAAIWIWEWAVEGQTREDIRGRDVFARSYVYTGADPSTMIPWSGRLIDSSTLRARVGSAGASNCVSLCTACIRPNTRSSPGLSSTVTRKPVLQLPQRLLDAVTRSLARHRGCSSNISSGRLCPAVPPSRLPCVLSSPPCSSLLVPSLSPSIP
jgi:hypothetical protein